MKQEPKGTMGVRIILAGFGLLWTVFTYSMTSMDRMTPAAIRFIFPCFGILFIIAAFTIKPGKDSSSGDEEGTAGKSETTLQRQERPAAPREKKTVFCPYCGTALEEDYKVCGSCGAPRKSK